MQWTVKAHHAIGLVAVLLLTLTLYGLSTEGSIDAAEGYGAVTDSFIVQASSGAAAKTAVTRVGGRVTDILDIINAVGAELTVEQAAQLRSLRGKIKVFPNKKLNVSGSAAETYYPSLVGAAELHEQGITGNGVTLAVLDTGIWKTNATEFSASGKQRILAQHDATTPSWLANNQWGDDDDDSDDSDGDDDNDEGWWGGFSQRSWCWHQHHHDIDDWNGHGTHVTSIAVSSGQTVAGRYQGIAPNANVVAVRAFEPDGSGTYLNVIKALDWIVSHKTKYNIRILNLSFGATAASNYWDDPVNQAVMATWDRGIVVVAAAGNGGPGPMTVGVPGNVPYIITVGAITDNYTPDDTSDDRLATFSAAGPTLEGFVKPEILAPGGHMLGQMPPYAWLPLEHPGYVTKVDDSFTMSGTSQAAAVVSGVLALMLEADPFLTPDQTKCRLMASSRTARRDDGEHAYSVFQQGAGRVDALAAIAESAANCANLGTDISLDIAGYKHYAGRAGVDQQGTYFLVDEYGQRLLGAAFEWKNGSLWLGDAHWQQAPMWSQGAVWPEGVVWDPQSSPDSESLLNQGAVWPEGAIWNEGLTRPVSTSVWVEEE